MRKSLPAAISAIGGTLAAATIGASNAAAAEPTISWGTSFGGTSINHFTTAPNGALFDGDIITVQPGINAGIVGLLADATPGDRTCATGRFVLYPKTGAPEVLPVGTSCGIPFPYLVVAARPAGDYAEVCGEVDVADPSAAAGISDPSPIRETTTQHTETCFRLPNE